MPMIRTIATLIGIAIAILILPTLVYGFVAGLMAGDDSTSGDVPSIVTTLSMVACAIFVLGATIYVAVRAATDR